MTNNTNNFNFLHLDKVDSTNNYVKENYAELPNLTVVYSDCQTSGRGRMGRKFHSPRGAGLYFSLLLKNNISSEKSKYLTVISAVAVLEELKKYTDRDLKIKWVNDVYIDGKKVCGILTEGSVNPQDKSFKYAVIGIGINLKTPENGFPEELSEIVDSVFGREYDHSKNQEILYGVVTRIYNMLISDNLDFIDRYRQYSFLDGKKVNIIRDGFTESATALYIDGNCNLVAQSDGNGEKITLFSGDVSVKLNNKTIDNK